MANTDLSSRYTLFVLKPDAIDQALDPIMINDLEEAGLTVVKHKLLHLTPEQAAVLYSEKERYNYFSQLVSFMASSQSFFLLIKFNHDTEADIVIEAKKYRDWARLHLKLDNYELTESDMRQLAMGTHPLQAEITTTMALRNLIHVPDDLESVMPLLAELFTEDDIDELENREPELHAALSVARQEIAISRDIETHSSNKERG